MPLAFGKNQDDLKTGLVADVLQQRRHALGVACRCSVSLAVDALGLLALVAVLTVLIVSSSLWFVEKKRRKGNIRRQGRSRASSPPARATTIRDRVDEQFAKDEMCFPPIARIVRSSRDHLNVSLTCGRDKVNVSRFRRLTTSIYDIPQDHSRCADRQTCRLFMSSISSPSRISTRRRRNKRPRARALE